MKTSFLNVMPRLQWMIALLLFTSVMTDVAFPQQPAVVGSDATKSTSTSGKEPLKVAKGLGSPCWHSDVFAGTNLREFSKDGSSLRIQLDQQAGGFDTAIVKGYKPTHVDDIDDEAKVGGKAAVEIEVRSGKWWYGPKLAVRTQGTKGLEGNYENYVVENSSVSSEDFHKQRMRLIEKRGGAYLGKIEQDGSAYRLYRGNHKEWLQFWAIREDYRSTGSVSIKPILAMWRKHGMRNDVVGSVRLNLETSGEMHGTFRIHDPVFPASLTATQSPPAGDRPRTIDAAEYSSLQAAVDALPLSGGTVTIPAGVFEISKPIEIRTGDVLLRGSGPSTHIKNLNTKDRPAILVDSQRKSERKRLETEPLWRVQLTALRITGNEKSGHGIEARFVNELFVDGLTISHHGGDGVHLHHCLEDARVNDALLMYNKQSGVHSLGCHDTVIVGNQFEENRDGVRFVDGFNLCMTGNNLDDHLRNAVVVDNSMGNVITGNMIEECAGIGVLLQRNTFATTVGSNIFTNDKKGGVDLRDAHGCTVSGNTFSRIPQNSVAVDAKCHSITISGNNFSDADVGDGEFLGRLEDNVASGIVLQGASRIGITGNTFSNITGKALSLSPAASRHVVFANNLLIDSASDHDALQASIVANNLVTSKAR